MKRHTDGAEQQVLRLETKVGETSTLKITNHGEACMVLFITTPGGTVFRIPVQPGDIEMTAGADYGSCIVTLSIEEAPLPSRRLAN